MTNTLSFDGDIVTLDEKHQNLFAIMLKESIPQTISYTQAKLLVERTQEYLRLNHFRSFFSGVLKDIESLLGIEPIEAFDSFCENDDSDENEEFLNFHEFEKDRSRPKYLH